MLATANIDDIPHNDSRSAAAAFGRHFVEGLLLPVLRD
jgi:hypothetical protein